MEVLPGEIEVVDMIKGKKMVVWTLSYIVDKLLIATVCILVVINNFTLVLNIQNTAYRFLLRLC